MAYIDCLQAPVAPASSLNDVGVDLWGFDSIQILKGPASVLYGESPPGELLDLSSRRPQDAFGAEIRGRTLHLRRRVLLRRGARGLVHRLPQSAT